MEKEVGDRELDKTMERFAVRKTCHLSFGEGSGRAGRRAAGTESVDK